MKQLKVSTQSEQFSESFFPVYFCVGSVGLKSTTKCYIPAPPLDMASKTDKSTSNNPHGIIPCTFWICNKEVRWSATNFFPPSPLCKQCWHSSVSLDVFNISSGLPSPSLNPDRNPLINNRLEDWFSPSISLQLSHSSLWSLMFHKTPQKRRASVPQMSNGQDGNSVSFKNGQGTIQPAVRGQLSVFHTGETRWCCTFVRKWAELVQTSFPGFERYTDDTVAGLILETKPITHRRMMLTDMALRELCCCLGSASMQLFILRSTCFTVCTTHERNKL